MRERKGWRERGMAEERGLKRGTEGGMRERGNRVKNEGERGMIARVCGGMERWMEEREGRRRRD